MNIDVQERSDMESESKIEIGVNLFFAVGCAVIAMATWGIFLQVACFNMFKWGYGFCVGAGFVLIINTAHFLFGCFHVDDDLSEYASDKPILTRDYRVVQLARWKIISILTVAPSRYLRAAVDAYRRAQNRDEQSAKFT